MSNKRVNQWLLRCGVGMVTLITGASFIACGKEATTIDDLKIDKIVTLGQYKGIEIEEIKAEVDEENVNSYALNLYINQGKKVADYEGVIQENDTANIDFTGYVDGVAFDNGSATDKNLTIGSNSYIEGFESGLIGIKAGESTDLNLRFPDDYENPNLAGKDVVFRVKVNYIIPALTDEMVKKLENKNYTSVEELKNYTRGVITKNSEDKIKESQMNTVMKIVMEKTTFTDIPQFILDEESEKADKKYGSTAEMYGVTLDEYLQGTYGITEQTYIEYYAKERLLLKAIAKAEGIGYSDSEYEKKLEEFAGEYGGGDVDSILQASGYTRETYKEFLIGMEVYTFLYDNAVIKAAE